VAGHPRMLFLDEIQFVPDWQTWLKRQADFQRGRRIAATGSASPLRDGSTESGVGRWQTIPLPTLSFSEYLRLRKAADAGDPVIVDPSELAALVRVVDEGELSRANGKEVLEAHAATGHPAARIIEERGFRQISDSGAVTAAVDAAIAANPAAVADYRAGKQQAVGFLVGQVMKATRGQANAAMVQATVRERLDDKQA